MTWAIRNVSARNSPYVIVRPSKRIAGDEDSFRKMALKRFISISEILSNRKIKSHGAAPNSTPQAFGALTSQKLFVPFVAKLFPRQLTAGVEVVPVQDRVEDEEVAALRLPAPERVRREQQ